MKYMNQISIEGIKRVYFIVIIYKKKEDNEYEI